MENITYEISNEIKIIRARVYGIVSNLENIYIANSMFDEILQPISDAIWDDVHSKVLAEIKKELTYGKYQR
jgi:hypothetical protein